MSKKRTTLGLLTVVIALAIALIGSSVAIASPGKDIIPPQITIQEPRTVPRLRQGT